MNILNDNKQLQPNVFLGNLFDFQGQNWPEKIIFCFKSPKISNVSYNQKNFRQLFMIQSLLSVHEIFHTNHYLLIYDCGKIIKFLEAVITSTFLCQNLSSFDSLLNVSKKKKKKRKRKVGPRSFQKKDFAKGDEWVK